MYGINRQFFLTECSNINLRKASDGFLFPSPKEFTRGADGFIYFLIKMRTPYPSSDNFQPVAEFINPDWGDKVNFGI
jgi:hypothetical protein